VGRGEVEMSLTQKKPSEQCEFLKTLVQSYESSDHKKDIFISEMYREINKLKMLIEG